MDEEKEVLQKVKMRVLGLHAVLGGKSGVGAIWLVQGNYCHHESLCHNAALEEGSFLTYDVESGEGNIRFSLEDDLDSPFSAFDSPPQEGLYIRVDRGAGGFYIGSFPNEQDRKDFLEVWQEEFHVPEGAKQLDESTVLNAINSLPGDWEAFPPERFKERSDFSFPWFNEG